MLDRCVLCHFAELFTLLHQTSDVHQNHSHGSIKPHVGHQTAGALKTADAWLFGTRVFFYIFHKDKPAYLFGRKPASDGVCRKSK